LTGQYWTRVRFVTDTLVTSDEPLTPQDLQKAAENAGVAVRTTAYEGVKNATISFLPEHKYSVCHVHDATDENCMHCRSHSRDELGPDYTS